MPVMYRNFVIVAVSILSFGCAATSAPYAGNGSDCSRNFTVQGTPLLGQVFRTEATIRQAPPSAVLDRMRARFRREGYEIREFNFDDGILKAVGRTTSNNYTEPTVVGVSPEGRDSHVVLSFSTLAGQFVAQDAVHRELCGFIEDANHLAYSASAQEPSRKKPLPILGKKPTASKIAKNPDTPASQKAVAEPKSESASSAQATETAKGRY